MTRVRLRVGGTTDVGRARQANQDSLHLGAGVYVVADGMGGHAGGEVASRIAVDAIATELPDGPARVLDLVTAVQAANDQVWAASAGDPSLAGMGTTVVAAGVVEEDGEERIAIVNVGDSRAYLLTGGELLQVSDDHSLVGDLVREGRLSKADARTHPQKNIVTRAIGIDRVVQVDEFQVLPRTGDRYLLCSDGLTDEVDDDAIATALRTIDDPDELAAHLVAQANANGGRDNITVLVLDVLDDGRDDPAPAGSPIVSVPDDADYSTHPDQDTAAVGLVPGHVPVGDDGQPLEPVVATRRPRALTLRSAAFVSLVVLVVAGGGLLAYRYGTSTYFVGIDDEQVTIFQGRPGGFLWLDPEPVEDTGIDVDDVPDAVLADLEAGVDAPTLARARRYVANLEDRIAELTPSTTTTTTTFVLTPPTTSLGSTTTSTTP